MKRFLPFLLAAVLVCSILFGAAAENAAAPTPFPSEKTAEALTSAELDALAGQLLSLAQNSEPLNDPTAEDAQYEDGVLFRYAFAALYCDRAEMTPDTRIQSYAISAGRDPVIRDTGIDSTLEEVLACYPNENEHLTGTSRKALLYLEEEADGNFRYGLVLRDGQRITQIVYGSAEKEGEQYRLSRLIYSLQSGMVSEISAAGLGSSGLTDQSLRDELYREISELRGENAYARVPTSAVGTDLTPFGAEDLSFSGFQLEGAKPEDMPGKPEIIGPEDWDGVRSAIRVVGDGYEAVFICDADGSNPLLLTFDITGKDLEGPRCVRLGDALYEDLNRFRHGENETDGVTELLYGTAGQAPYGLADYAGDDGMRLTYVTKATDGREVTMILQYENALLASIYLMADGE